MHGQRPNWRSVGVAAFLKNVTDSCGRASGAGRLHHADRENQRPCNIGKFSLNSATWVLFVVGCANARVFRIRQIFSRKSISKHSTAQRADGEEAAVRVLPACL